VPPHRGAVAAAALGRPRRAAAVDMRDLPVTQPHQVRDRLPYPFLVVRPYDVDGRVAHVAGDHHHRDLPGELAEARPGGLGTEEDQRLAAVVQERLDRAALVTAGRQRAERDVVAGRLGRGVDALQQVGVERLVRAERDPEQPGPAAGQQPGTRVGPVAELGRAGQDPLAGLLAWARRAADDQRDQRAGHTRTGRDVLQRWSPALGHRPSSRV
jgi:hypothetical protein